ncbi:MAG: hypothetical protein ABI615_04830 [Chthoniobacterales bacterium]
MKKTITYVVIIIVILLSCIGGYWYYSANSGFGPWLERTEFNAWVSNGTQNKTVYVSAVEGRLLKSTKQWRARLSPIEHGVTMDRRWWFDMNENFYRERFGELTGQEKYDQIWSQSFLDQHGDRNYQAVFRKISLREKKKP